MPIPLGNEEFDILQNHVDAGDRIAYYDQLEAWGYRYGDLAGGVVSNDSFSGATANIYFVQEYLEDTGSSFNFNNLASLSLQLMARDLAARRTSDEVKNGEDLSVDSIRDYHVQVFNQFGVQADAWTPFTALAQLNTLEERQELWDSLLNAGTVSGNMTSYINILTTVGFSDPDYVFDLTTAGGLATTAESTDYGPYFAEIGNGGFAIGGNAEDNTGLVGTANNDVLMGFDGNDILNAGMGNDRLYGGNDDDTVVGGAGEDQLYSGTGDDFLFAGGQVGTEFSGSDGVFNPNFANVDFPGLSASNYADGEVDYLFGGEGNDNYFVAGQGVITGNGWDASRTIGSFPFDDPNGFNKDVYDHIDIIRDTDGNGQIWYGLAGLEDIGLDLGVTQLAGGSYELARSFIDGEQFFLWGREYYDNNVIVDFHTDELTGISSNRLVFYESETYHALFAIDGFFNGAFGLTLEGYESLFDGNEDDNDIDGTDGNDTINGGDGDDILNGLGGIDILNGGDGDDTVIIDEFDTEFYGSGGIDTIVYNGDADFEYALDQGAFEHARFGSGDDSIYGNGSRNNIEGGAGDDTLFGYGGKDVLTGGEGADSLQGGGGNDTVIIDDDDVWFSGDGGVDTLIDTGTAGRVYALAQGSFENASMGSGDDSVFGTDGDNEIDGGAGDDSLFGEGGNDTLNGGVGNDGYIYASGDGNDVIEDVSSSGDQETDVIVFTDLNSNQVSLSASGDDLVITDNTTNSTITVRGNLVSPNNGDGIEQIFFANDEQWDRARIFEEAGIPTDPYEGWERGTNGQDTYVGSKNQPNQYFGDGGKDTITGGRKADELAGGKGNDTIKGSNGNDQLFGNEGNDKLNGGNNNDILDGGAGKDTLTGGKGNDTFVYADGYGADTIKDFAKGNNTIQLNVEGINSFADIQGIATQVGKNLVLDFGNGDKLTLAKRKLNQLNENDFEFGSQTSASVASSSLATSSFFADDQFHFRETATSQIDTDYLLDRSLPRSNPQSEQDSQLAIGQYPDQPLGLLEDITSQSNLAALDQDAFTFF